jgi:hypothetical protein
MFAFGLKLRLEMLSFKGGVICTSLFGFRFAGAVAAAWPNMVLVLLQRLLLLLHHLLLLLHRPAAARG